MSAVVATLLVAWAIASVLNQLPLRWFNSIKVRDAFAVIPSWSFFAPNPGHTDLQLLMCDEYADGAKSFWRAIDLESNRSIWTVLWNPVKRRNKTLTDMTAELAFLSRYYSAESVMLTVSYLVLLNVVLHEPHDERAVRTEFVIMETFGRHSSRQPEIRFASGLHALEHRR